MNETRVRRSAPRTLAVAALAAASLAASTPALAADSAPAPAPARSHVTAVETADVTASGLPKKCALKVQYKGKQTWWAKAEGDAYRVGENGSQSKWSKKVKS
ncbi:hypothetical protein [Streptomyces sp. NPDC002851]